MRPARARTRLLRHADGVDFASAGHVGAGVGAGREQAVFAPAERLIEHDLIDAWRDFLGLKLEIVADRAARSVEDAAGDGAELAGAALHAKAQQLVLGDVDALGYVDRQSHREGEDILSMLARNVAVHVAFDNAFTGDALKDAAGFEVHDFGLEVLPGAVSVLEVHADVIDAGRASGCGGSRRRSWCGRRRGRSCGLGNHGGNNFVADPGGLEGDDAVGGSVVGSGRGVDGGDDQVVGESRLDHFDDGLVIHRLLGGDGETGDEKENS